jgi:hypothetical protein
VSLPWPGWTWTDRRGAKGRIFTPLARRGVLRGSRHEKGQELSEAPGPYERVAPVTG